MSKLALKNPLVSEKGYLQAGRGVYSFYVAISETKESIKTKIEKEFKVNVLKINSQVLNGKVKKVKGKSGVRSDQKKMIVTLKSGQKIDIFETEKDEPKDKKKKDKKDDKKSTSEKENNDKEVK